MDDVTTAAKIIPAIFVALFPLVNPIGTAFVLYGMTGHIERRAWTAASRKIAVYVFLLLTAFLLFGGAILKFFGVSIPIVQLSGGLVVASIGWGLLNQKDSEPSATGPARDAAVSLEGKLFYPYTFPTTVGPGSIAVAMTFGAHVEHGIALAGDDADRCSARGDPRDGRGDRILLRAPQMDHGEILARRGAGAFENTCVFPVLHRRRNCLGRLECAQRLKLPSRRTFSFLAVLSKNPESALKICVLTGSASGAGRLIANRDRFGL